MTKRISSDQAVSIQPDPFSDAALAPYAVPAVADGSEPVPAVKTRPEGSQGQDETVECVGKWVSGSGGHRVHGPWCGQPATWTFPGDPYAYCEEHIAESDKTGPGAYLTPGQAFAVVQRVPITPASLQPLLETARAYRRTASEVGR